MLIPYVRDNGGLDRETGKIRLALLYGGRSGEHEISIRSAQSVRQALDPAKYLISDYFIAKDGRWQPAPFSPEPSGNDSIDVVFPLLHGTFGEDGTIQGLLDLAELPYVGAGVLASAVSMDKAITKKLCAEAGLPVVEHVVLTGSQLRNGLPELPFGFPVFVKPANLGSSVGITKAKCASELAESVRAAAEFDRKVVIERGIKGREFECAVLEADELLASIPCEIVPSQDFYTYEDKYLLNKARIDLPAKLEDAQVAEMQRLAKDCFNAVGCEGMARVDFLMEGATGKFFINEINTIPGFTSSSMFPKMWEYSGISYSHLIDLLIASAIKRAEEKKRIRYSK